MKKIRLMLSIFAFVFGIGGALASALFPLQDGYSKRADVQAAGGSQIGECQNRNITCDTAPGDPCTWIGAGMTTTVTLQNSACTQALNFPR